ncbi:efflux RND transporter periplasmic adaptor subunit [Massilia phyllosphaerae]|uniref:efflux RND transporter periplasmic adaptor subunit n=1 Tax=Massilia phyllosphaerae TaxID=3106034 RepID=UPI002B1CE22C|nr:efflux RND transporter periplasmic adaptor subunit [Massilia sp. SGZ-792]
MWTRVSPTSARLAGAVCLAALCACQRGNPPTPPAPPPPAVTVAQARPARVPVTLELPGRVNPVRVAQVRARVDGVVLKREFREGGDVQAGQRLFKIDPAPYVTDLQSAQATLGRAQANVAAQDAQAARFGKLVGSDAVSRQEFDNALASQGQAVADVASGRASVRSARINLGYTGVVAPITGRAGISAVTEGAYVQGNSATLMTTIQQIDPIYVDLTQSSVQGLRLRQDLASGKVHSAGPNRARVTVLLEDGTRYPMPGTVQFSDVNVDPGTASVTIRTLVPNPRHLLLPGMFVRGQLEAGVLEDALLVPQAGVAHDAQGQATALVVGRDGKVLQKTIQAPRTYGGDWVVTGGLDAGERVIVSGLQKARPGAPVRIAGDTGAAPGPASTTASR